MTNVKRKKMRRAPFVIALFVAVGVTSMPSTALAASARPAASCPQQAGEPCPKVGKRPAPPKQARPKVKPAQVNGPYGGPVWRSGPWLMS